MAYRDDIAALGADHHWDFDGDSLDQIGSANGTNTSMVFTSSAIAEDATNCAETNGRTDRVSIPTTTNINNSAQDRKCVSGWFMATAINPPPCRIYGEGNNSLCFHMVLAMGNNLMFEAVDSGFTLQVFGDVALASNRAYHLCMVFEGSGFGNVLRCYLDGVEQLNADNRVPGTATISARGVAEFGDPAGTVGVGGDTVLLFAPVNGRYNHWATWNAANAVLSGTEIREELFEKGALPEDTISTGTEVAMQTALNALADTLCPDAPLCIRVEDITGSGDLALSADNITFDPLASIHIQWMGAGTLTWTNTNGSDASIASTPNGGTVIFTQPVSVRVTCRKATDFSVIEDVQVSIEADTGGDLAAGTDIILALTNASGVVEDTAFKYTNNQPVTGRARKGGISDPFKTASIAGTITSAGLDIAVLMVPD